MQIPVSTQLVDKIPIQPCWHSCCFVHNALDETQLLVSKRNEFMAMSKQDLTQSGIHAKPVNQAQMHVRETGAQTPWNQTSNDLPAAAYNSRSAGKTLVSVRMSELFNGHSRG